MRALRHKDVASAGGEHGARLDLHVPGAYAAASVSRAPADTAAAAQEMHWAGTCCKAPGGRCRYHVGSRLVPASLLWANQALARPLVYTPLPGGGFGSPDEYAEQARLGVRVCADGFVLASSTPLEMPYGAAAAFTVVDDDLGAVFRVQHDGTTDVRVTQEAFVPPDASVRGVFTLSMFIGSTEVLKLRWRCDVATSRPQRIEPDVLTPAAVVAVAHGTTVTWRLDAREALRDAHEPWAAEAEKSLSAAERRSPMAL